MSPRWVMERFWIYQRVRDAARADGVVDMRNAFSATPKEWKRAMEDLEPKTQLIDVDMPDALAPKTQRKSRTLTAAEREEMLNDESDD